MRLVIAILIISLSSCTASRCKTPWWKRQPNSYFKQDQKQNKKKYKSHRKSERKKHKCKR